MALTVKQIEKLMDPKTPPGRHFDGGGLYLQVSPAKKSPNRKRASWFFRFEYNGVDKWMGLGSLTDYKLPEARERRDTYRAQLKKQNLNPIEARRAERDAKRRAETENLTFKEAAEQFLALHADGWKNAKHRQQWRNTLQTYAYPTLGSRPFQAIDAALINHTIAPIWKEIPETSARVKHRIERVLQWVKDGKPLPARSPSQRTRNHPSLPYQEISQFMDDLRKRESVSARALEFLILTAARTGEVIGATWDEFDLREKVWTIPAERMKASRQHRIPLSDRAIDILKAAPRERGNNSVFIGGQKGKGLSNMALLEMMRGIRLGYVPHGFRSTFKDWAAETTSYPNIVSEMALAHKVSDKTEAAYRRGDLLVKRTRLMRDWARYCETKPAKVGANVVPMRKAR